MAIFHYDVMHSLIHHNFNNNQSQQSSSILVFLLKNAQLEIFFCLVYNTSNFDSKCIMAEGLKSQVMWCVENLQLFALNT